MKKHLIPLLLGAALLASSPASAGVIKGTAHVVRHPLHSLHVAGHAIWKVVY